MKRVRGTCRAYSSTSVVAGSDGIKCFSAYCVPVRVRGGEGWGGGRREGRGGGKGGEGRGKEAQSTH